MSFDKETSLFFSIFFHFPLLLLSPPPSFSSSLSLGEYLNKREQKNQREELQKIAMKNAIRCCIACILPCGALDVIRIVHTNGKVEEISGTHVKAAEIMKLHPKHVLKKPSSSSSSSSSSSDEGSICPKIVIVPPDAELKRGKIYFLMPMPPSSSSSSSSAPKKAKNRSRAPTRKKKMRSSLSEDRENGDNANLLVSDQYLSDILLEKVSTQRDRRRGRVGVWRPHLESIYETPSES